MTEVNIRYLLDITAYMIEGQYFEMPSPEDYLCFIQFYKEKVFGAGDSEGQTKYLHGLKFVLKFILNNELVRLNDLMVKGAMHSFLEEEETKKVFILIWDEFFPHQEWRDDDPIYHQSVFEFVVEPIW